MKSNRFGYLYLLTTIILFSTYEVVSKTLVNKVDPFQVNFLRFFIGGVLLFFVILAKGDIAIKPKDLGKTAVVGIINVFFSMNLLQLSINIPNSKASIAAVIFSSNPIFVTIFAALIDREKIKLYKIVGLMFGVLGVIMISLNGMKQGFMNLKSPLLALLSAVLYGLYTVLGGKVSSKIGSLKMNSYSFLLGSLALLPFLVLYKVPVLKFDYSATFQIIYLSVFVTGIAYLTYFKGLALTGASKGSLVFFLKPVLASVFSVIILGERITTNFVFGTILIIFGIMLVLYWNKLSVKIGLKRGEV
uniref:DMT family transporter n=1 Tax=Acetivibrio cellulolyticus TaxID=35830 RepID=UPI000590D723|nr:DMT family transporter [Acetivibrio cellulolyticus]